MTKQEALIMEEKHDITAMEISLKNGIMNYEQRTTKNSSPASAEVFAKDVFVPLYYSL